MSEPRFSRDPEPPSGYVIEVCVHCGAHAVWPFDCGHKPEGFNHGPWTMAIRVTPSKATRRDLQEAMMQRARA